MSCYIDVIITIILLIQTLMSAIKYSGKYMKGTVNVIYRHSYTYKFFFNGIDPEPNVAFVKDRHQWWGRDFWCSL